MQRIVDVGVNVACVLTCCWPVLKIDREVSILTGFFFKSSSEAKLSLLAPRRLGRCRASRGHHLHGILRRAPKFSR